MTSTRSRLAALAAALTTALVLPTLSPVPASAEDYLDTEGVDISWTKGPLTVGTAAVVTITGTALTSPATVEVFDDDYKVRLDATITPQSPSVTLPLPTEAKGTRYYVVEVDEPAGDVYGEAYFELAVTGIPTSVNATFAKAAKVKAGAKAGTITGRTSAPGLPVEVQSRIGGGGWATLGATTSGPDGSYSLNVPTYWVGKHQLRIRVPATATAEEAIASGFGSVDVRRTGKLKGSSKHAAQYPAGVRWNPCQVIEYRLNPARMPKTGPRTVAYALAAITQETGLRFRYAGTTDFLPHARNEGDFPDNADIVVGWATPKQVPSLVGGTAGLGGSWYSSTDMALFNGGVAIDATQKMRNGLAGDRQLMMHELGHVVGLGHVNDTSLVMNPSMVKKLTYWGRGDVLGLTKVGARGGCLDGPDQARVSSRTAAPTKGTLVTMR